VAAKKTASTKDTKQTEETAGLPVGDDGRTKALDAAVNELTKRFGDGTIVRLGDATHMVVDVIPSGSLTIDIALGVGGIPRGRVTEIYGPESSGKTTLCLHVIAESQKRGGICAFVDMEHALDPSYAKLIGVNIDKLYISQPDTAEQALEIIETLVRSGALDVVVLDSVAALVPRVEIEGEMGDSHVGVQARLMSQALRKLSGAIKQSNVSVLFTNQIREKIGVMYGCFMGETPITLADGSTEMIERIVKERLDVEVLSYNHLSGLLEPRRIVNWFDNGTTNEFLRFTVASNDSDVPHTFTCTPNHMLLTPHGYEAAENVQAGDLLMTSMALDITLESVTSGAINGNAVQPIARPYQATAMPVIQVENVILETPVHRYDIEIEGNHCYVAGGVIVHNSPETQPGGRALKFYATVRLDVRKLESIKAGGGEVVGNRTRVRVTKNKVAPPFREAEFDIMFLEGGISKSGEVLDLGTDLAIIEKRGAFYRYNDGLLGQGRENAKVFLTENLAVRDEVENAIRERYSLPSAAIDPRLAGKVNGTPPPAPAVLPTARGSRNSNADADASKPQRLPMDDEDFADE